jgi:tripartite-type tricarboxylate transporter receptor subunit TctC
MNSRRTILIALASCLAFAAPAAAQPDNYPSKPVRFIVPWPAGGGTDVFARAIGQKLHDALGQPFIVDNRSGASGNIGASAVAKAPPDGYTIMIGTITLATNPGLYSSLDFDATKDLAAVTLIADIPHVLVVNPAIPARSVAELVALAKSKPGKLSYASAGVGSPFHIAAEFFKSTAGVDLLHVPYKGGAPAISDVVGGHADVTFANLVAVYPQIQGGLVRALAVTTAKRSATLPDVPTLAEAGLKDYAFASWFGIFVPAGTPPAIVKKLNAEIVKILRSPEISERLSKEGADLIASSPEYFADYLKSETAKWSTLVRAAGIRAD